MVKSLNTILKPVYTLNKEHDMNPSYCDMRPSI